VAGEDQATAAAGTPPAAKDAAPAVAPATKLPLPAVVAIYVVAVLAAAVLVERVLVPWADAKTSSAPTVAAAPAESRARESKHGGEGGGGREMGDVYVIEDLVVNPAESGGMRYVAASVGLRSANPTFIEDMKSREAPIKDALIRILGSKNVDQLADIKARESMRGEILTEVDRLIPDQRVDAVYFTRFVLQ